MRVPDLGAFRQAILSCSTQGDPATTRSTAVVVPTRGAARQLARSYAAAGRDEADRPMLVTREELYDLFNARLDEPRDRLTASEREVILRSAAAAA